jgi:hypothetical protein
MAGEGHAGGCSANRAIEGRPYKGEKVARMLEIRKRCPAWAVFPGSGPVVDPAMRHTSWSLTR